MVHPAPLVLNPGPKSYTLEPVRDSLAGFREMSAPMPTDSALHRNNPQHLFGRAPARNDVGTFWRCIIATAGVCAEMNNLGTQEGENHCLLELYSSIQPQMLLEGSLQDRRDTLPGLMALNSIDNDLLNGMIPGGTPNLWIPLYSLGLSLELRRLTL